MSTDTPAAEFSAGARTAPGPDVFVTVGTDHHPFDRLVAWADSWARAHPEAGVTIQYGQASAPVVATGLVSLPATAVHSRMAAADVVITQGGPGGIIDCRSVGRLPIVVPRRHDLGEHVDDHQLAFARYMAGVGRIALADDEDTFRELIDRAVADPDAFSIRPDPSPTASTVAAIDAQINRIARRRRGLRALRRR
ncbi:hypothetical protein KIH74_16485 [Kineosporia sp. J2-2]|uniref:Glycosyl transferase family 28 C-terminal domain-containing protein n=1 Tax=Kineosporia corallincola TaxID=2835133 RepID=A0ABS5TI53_9ACTN|nr:glycosyltransferase [Kineosporia corallincola]MBT0770543.1 hypothetical protein [Kineosporia corallincola]